MKLIKEIQVNTIVEKIVGVKCDVCGTVYDDENDKNGMEYQEFLFVNFDGGYSSVFGDMNNVQCDICQHCLDKLIGHYVRINKEIK